MQAGNALNAARECEDLKKEGENRKHSSVDSVLLYLFL